MMELKEEDMYAAFLLSWLKYTVVSEEDAKAMENHKILVEKQAKESKIRKNENPGTQLPKRIRISSGSSSGDGTEFPREQPRNKNPQTQEASSAFGNSNPILKKVINLPKYASGSSSYRTELPKFPPIENLRSSFYRTELPKFPPIENLRTLIGKCSNPFEKQLTKSDVDEHQGRLLLNSEDVRRELLPMLNGESENLANGIKVTTFDPMGRFYNMRFKTWGNYKSYVLLGSWRQFIKEHRLKDHDCVTVWMFRNNQTDELCFALTWRGEEEA